MSEPFELRARKLYRESEQVKLVPGDSATVNRRQLRAMQDAIGKARAEGRLRLDDAKAELAMLRAVREQIDALSRPIGIKLAPSDREFSIRKRQRPEQRQQRKAKRKARATARPPKKSKSRKRRQ
jgi:hypothetical protein